MPKDYSTSDKLAIALACLAGVMTRILFLIEKSPLTVVGLLTLMVALSVYPILHFAKSVSIRIGLGILVVFGGLVVGWSSWPKHVQTEAKVQPGIPSLPNPKQEPQETKSTSLPAKKPSSENKKAVTEDGVSDPNKVAVRVLDGAKWDSTNDTVYGENGIRMEGKAQVTSRGLRVNPPTDYPSLVSTIDSFIGEGLQLQDADIPGWTSKVSDYLKVNFNPGIAFNFSEEPTFDRKIQYLEKCKDMAKQRLNFH